MSPHLCSMSRPLTHDAETAPAPAASTTPVTPPGAGETHTTISAVVAPTFLVAPSQPSIKAIRISQSDLEKIEILDHRKNNWTSWSGAMQNLLLLNHGSAYILGALPCPADATSAVNWDLNNLCIIAALQMHSTPEEQVYLRTFTNAHLAWSSL
ncbi:hypothetical protein BS17DRAFT_876953 [Gyrodon lividus]|nr:hypothetical protein BS17DRAFT_876953 [Gyrodon lividus]